MLIDSLELKLGDMTRVLSSKQATLLSLDEKNKLHLDYKNKLRLTDEIISELQEFKHELTKALGVIEKEKKLYERASLDKIVELVNIKMRYLRPLDKYILRMYIQPINSEKYLHVEIKHEDEPDTEFVPPATDMGKFMKQLISLSICLAVAVLLGQEEIMLDEPLASASGTSLLMMQEIIRSYNMTYYIVDQKQEMYSNLPRREFHLEKVDDGYRGYTVLANVVDII